MHPAVIIGDDVVQEAKAAPAHRAFPSQRNLIEVGCNLPCCSRNLHLTGSRAVPADSLPCTLRAETPPQSGRVLRRTQHGAFCLFGSSQISTSRTKLYWADLWVPQVDSNPFPVSEEQVRHRTRQSTPLPDPPLIWALLHAFCTVCCSNGSSRRHRALSRRMPTSCGKPW